MTEDEAPSAGESEQVFSSTTWEWRRTKIRRPPEAHSGSRPKGDYWRRLPWRSGREPLKISVSYRGGPQCWYEIHARGGVMRVPGDRALHDVMARINNQRG